MLFPFNISIFRNHPVCFLKFCDIYLFPCFCPICVNLFLMSNVLFLSYVRSFYFPASSCHCICLALLHLLEFVQPRLVTCFTCFLFRFHFYFVSSCVVVLQQDVQRFLVSRCSKIFQCVLRFHKSISSKNIHKFTKKLSCLMIFEEL